jgi:aerobic carbon-monoxide dehydrogenase small subunit
MKQVSLTINGRKTDVTVEPRTHLADLLREQMNLTATHLRCEQGACGACTILIDGQPARSCITYVVMCDGAVVQTIEGLEHDTAIVALRRAFSEEHGLQCGYCTPGMLITARDIILRLPGADQKRIRNELSGNLCRCTGYVGIVRAISRVLRERRDGALSSLADERGPLGPVGMRRAQSTNTRAAAPFSIAALGEGTDIGEADAAGLGGRKPNVKICHSFAVSRPRDEVWLFFADFARVVSCLPGASLTKPPSDGNIEGKITVKLGPIIANFVGHARVVRDDSRHCGLILGAGSDQLAGSRAAGEVEYALEATRPDETHVTLVIRALLSGALAQFGRTGILEDLTAQITRTFARNIESDLSGVPSSLRPGSSLEVGSLFWSVLKARARKIVGKLFASWKS